MTYGWNVEMQMRAAHARLRILEIPVPCRRRIGGASKVAGNVSGTLRAGTRIVSTIARIAVRARHQPGCTHARARRMNQVGKCKAETSRVPPASRVTCLLLNRDDYAAPSVFLPQSLLREARRQKALPDSTVPPVCVLDPDGDLVAYARRHFGRNAVTALGLLPHADVGMG